MKTRILVSAIILTALLVSLVPQPVSAATYCDAAQFIADITIPDGTYLSAGTSFDKTWRLKNIGTCTWTTSYSVVFVSGSQLDAPSSVNLPTSVGPGQSVDVTVPMKAPMSIGHYRGYWMLRNGAGVIFGIGIYANSWFWVDINVSASYAAAYDFVANSSAASWSSGAGSLAFPGVAGDPNGYGMVLSAPKLENGVVYSSPGLLMVPQNVYNGYIKAVYPAFSVQSGDRFQSIVNCEYGATSCYVTFRLDYQIGSGPVQTFWSFREKLEGLYYHANLDLSSLAGSSVKFILYISASGSASGDRAVWAGPKIVRMGSTPIPTPGPGSACDRAELVADVTVPDGTNFGAGTAFTKTWRLKNVGTCTWTTAYKLVFAGGDSMGASPLAYNLPSSVAPGATVDLSVNLTAPITAGHYIGYWRLRNASDVDFGIGSSGTGSFTVDINVLSTFSSVYDFSSNACAATWTSGAGVLPCPGADGDPKGFVLGLSNPVREDGSTGYAGLLTFPQNVIDGYIQGKFPAFGVQNGDRFQADVYCQYGSISCYVTFRLDYQIGSGPVYTLKSAREAYEGLFYHMDVDLSSLAGQNVNFILFLQSNGSPSGDRAIWSAPRIVRSGTTPVDTPTPTTDPSLPPTPTAVIPGPHADLSVTINDGLSTFVPGGTSTYTVVVTNNGPDNVTGAVLGVIKPIQITDWVVSCTPDSGATCSAGPFTVASSISDTVNIPAGKKLTYTIQAHVSASAVGNCVVTATINSPGAVPDPNLSNNSATDTDAPPSADLSVTKTDGVTAYTSGGTVTYTIVVTNNGPLNVTGASFTDPKPTQVTSWKWTCAPDSGASCTAGPSTISTNFSDTVNIPVGKKVTYTAVATLSPAAVGDLVNTATITPPVGMPDPLPANNTATDTDLGPLADLSVTKTDGVTMYTPGGTVTYTIVVSNLGPQNVLFATFSDVKPANITSWSWTCLADLGAICTAGPVAPVDFTDSVSIPAGKKVTYNVVANIDPLATGNLVNTATILSPSTISDPNLANNTATDTDSPPTADLSVTISDGITIYPPGGTVTYTVVVTNNGPSAVTGASFQDIKPPQVVEWIWVCTADSGAVCNPGPVTTAGDFADMVDIPSGKKVTYTVVATIASPTSGNLVNTVVITAPAGITDPVVGNNSATDTDAHPSADLSVTNTDMVIHYIPGGTVTYTIVVSNTGPSNVIGATFTDILPWQITSWTWTCVPELGAICLAGTVTSSINFVDIVNIPIGKKITYTAVATIDPLAGGPMVNTATITAPLDVPDWNLVNNSASDIDTP